MAADCPCWSVDTYFMFGGILEIIILRRKGNRRRNLILKSLIVLYACFNYNNYNGLLHSIKDLEMPGIEPGAFHMQSERSTTELHPLA
jgi:hypothetical protein